MKGGEQVAKDRFAQIVSIISGTFKYDPQLLFSDTFERISQQLTQAEELIVQANTDPKDYWIVHNMVISLLPVVERLVFAGYSDQILQFLLSVNRHVASNLMFCTSRFIPFRLQLFLVVCSAMANTDETRDKDAEAAVRYFRTEINGMKELEEGNVNGLTESVNCCDGKAYLLSDLYEAAFMMLDMVNIHFTIEDIEFERGAGGPKGPKKKGARPVKDEPQVHTVAIPSLRSVHLVINAFASPLAKTDYISKYGQMCQVWTSPECQLSISLLYRLMFCFLKAGKLDGEENLLAVFPDDVVVKLVVALASEDWQKVSDIMVEIPKEIVATDFTFFNEIALKIWKRFVAGTITDPLVLSGVLRILCVSPSPCPMITALVALEYCWHLESLERYHDADAAAEATIEVVEAFRDTFAVRKCKMTLAPSDVIPTKALDQSYMSFEKWLECLYTDVYCVWIKCRLKDSLTTEISTQEQDFANHREETEKQRVREEQMYGVLDAKQRRKYDKLLNRSFVPPIHAKAEEEALLQRFKNNYYVRALIYVQMASFRPKQAIKLLARARDAMREINTVELPASSPVIYANRTEIALICRSSMPRAKNVAVFGKECVGSTGLTLSNTALHGSGVKQGQVEPFVITKLKPNTLYTFAFGGFDANDELIDSLLEPFSIASCHPMPLEMIWSYIASASFRLKDPESFDPALSYLVQRFTDIRGIPASHDFMQNTNPFNRFMIKPSTFSEPAPMLRAFSSALIMAARMFAQRPLHATAFQKIAVVLSRIIRNQTLTLSVCYEIYATLQPLLVNQFHTKWTVQPLLYIISALKANKETIKMPMHQELSAKASYALNQILVMLYQERPLCQYSVSSAMEVPVNEHRSAFALQASRQQLLESASGDPTLPAVASDIFRNSPERAYDDLFNKFKADPLFPQAAVYVISCGHNVGLNGQGATWAGQALEYIKNTLREPEEKAPKKANAKGKAPPPKKGKVPAGRAQKNEPVQEVQEDAEEIAAGNKIGATWRKYVKRRNNARMFGAVNKYRAALNLYLGMCLVEMETGAPTAQGTERGGTSRKGKPKGKPAKDKKGAPVVASGAAVVEDDSFQPEQAMAIIAAIKRAIVLGDRADLRDIMKSTSSMLSTYLASAGPGSMLYSVVAPLLVTTVEVMISCFPLTEPWAQQTIKDCLMVMLHDGQLSTVILLLDKAGKACSLYGDLIWLISEAEEVPPTLKKAYEEVQTRDPAENTYHAADAILGHADPANMTLFPSEADTTTSEMLIKVVGDMAISLQHKQRLSMSASLLTKLAFILLARGETNLAIQKMNEALECHFRVVRVHERIDQVLEGETEENFYKKHSWAGCLSIFVISAFLSKYAQRNISLMLAKLGAFALSSLFCASLVHPKKAVDFAEFEPSEIVPGVDIFSDSDPNQLLLEMPSAANTTLAFMLLLSALDSFEMHFEMFKPLAVARHFFRFIVRDSRGLCRTRLQAVLACCQFGFLDSAVNVMSDVILNYGQCKSTKETGTVPSASKRVIFDITAPAGSQVNMDAVKTLSTTAQITAIAQMYGTTLSFQYCQCLSRICCTFSEAYDPTGTAGDKAPTTSQGGASARKQRRSHSKSKDEAPAAQRGSGAAAGVSVRSSSETPVVVLKIAETLLSDCLNKEFRRGQREVRRELTIEKALVFMKQWRWESAIKSACDVINEQSIDSSRDKPLPVPHSYTDQGLLTSSGLIAAAHSVIARSSFNLNDWAVVEEYGSPYQKALLLIRKADIEGAVAILATMTARKPVTRFHIEYTLAVGQLLTLLCTNKKLEDIWRSKSRKATDTISLIREVSESTTKFFVEELKMRETRSFYIRNTFLLVRLKHLEAAVTVCSGRGGSAIGSAMLLLESAEGLMKDWCPFTSLSLVFHLTITSLRLQMQQFLTSTPNIMRMWNQDAPEMINVSNETVDAMLTSLQAILSQSPDLVVHPLARQAAMDLVLLTGVLQGDPDMKLEQSFNVLKLAHSVRSAKRIIQGMISRRPDTAPMNCSQLLMSDNPDQSQRALAASYYAHVCSLDLPLFDTEILDMRSLLFYRFYEEQLEMFKLGNKGGPVEPGMLVGEWYEMKAPAASAKKQHHMDTSTIVTRRSSVAATSFGGSSVSSVSASQSRASSQRRPVCFFLGILADDDKKKAANPTTAKDKGAAAATTGPARLLPIMLASSMSDLNGLCEELAELGLEIEDANRVIARESEAESHPAAAPPAEAVGKGKRKPPPKGAKPVVETPDQTATKVQVNVALQQAVLKWNTEMNKLETFATKSNRLMTSLLRVDSNRWPAQVKADGLDPSLAFPLSHLVNPDLGINEKAPPLVEWLVSTFIPAEPSSQRT